MFSIYKKEISAFFSSFIGYMAIIVFLVLTGFFVWINPGSNILDYGFATLDQLFYTAPWVFMILIPAVTMRSFSEEISTGTIEMLTTKPVTEMDIILGKYFAALTLVLFSIVPTFIYYFTVYQLGVEKGNLDSGSIMGSYIGLIFLASAFVSIGLFASSLTGNQIIAFVVAATLCFMLHYAFDLISGLSLFYAKVDDIVQQIGINAHYVSISRGVVDTRDLVYFISLTAVFLLFTKLSLERRKW